MSAESEPTAEAPAPGPAAPAFKRTELQRAPSPVAGWEIVQTLVEIPEGIGSGGIHNAVNVGTVTTMMLSTYFIDETKPLSTLY